MACDKYPRLFGRQENGHNPKDVASRIFLSEVNDNCSARRWVIPEFTTNAKLWARSHDRCLFEKPVKLRLGQRVHASVRLTITNEPRAITIRRASAPFVCSAARLHLGLAGVAPQTS